MQLFVPTIGSKLKLLEDWSFTVFDEHRNKSLGQFAACPKAKDDFGYWQANNIGTLTFPKDTVLRVDRIFIRQGMDGFDSMTFVIEKIDLPLASGVKKAKRLRFWAKLEDCNTIKFEFTL